MEIQAKGQIVKQTITAAPVILIGLMLCVAGVAHAQTPLDRQAIERALDCSDLDAIMDTMKKLPSDLAAAAKAGFVQREQLTSTTRGPMVDHWEYRFPRPFPLWGAQPVGIGNSLGMLPAMVVIFDEPLGSLRERYERKGFKFECTRPSELQGESCEGSLYVPQSSPDEPSLKFLVTIIESPVFLKTGRTVVACTVIPREGNIFR